MAVEESAACSEYPGRYLMAGKKQTDATGNLPPDHPTQIGPGGTKIGLPTRDQVMADLAKVAKAKNRPS
jgi:hypothetical protein